MFQDSIDQCCSTSGLKSSRDFSPVTLLHLKHNCTDKNLFLNIRLINKRKAVMKCDDWTSAEVLLCSKPHVTKSNDGFCSKSLQSD